MTKTNQGSEPSGETSAIGNGVQSYDTWDEMLESWRSRSIDLANEIQSMGGSAVVMISIFDPALHDSDDNAGEIRETPSIFIRRGNYHTVLGMLVDTQRQMLE